MKPPGKPGIETHLLSSKTTKKDTCGTRRLWFADVGLQHPLHVLPKPVPRHFVVRVPLLSDKFGPLKSLPGRLPFKCQPAPPTPNPREGIDESNADPALFGAIMNKNKHQELSQSRTITMRSISIIVLIISDCVFVHLPFVSQRTSRLRAHASRPVLRRARARSLGTSDRSDASITALNLSDREAARGGWRPPPYRRSAKSAKPGEP